MRADCDLRADRVLDGVVAPLRAALGNDPKLTDPFGRYVLTTFVKGTNMGPYEAARHISGGLGA
ncbi:hypothetical protein ACIHCQ_35575 [Streptomyces sp. NPDC052236]|uniref:hypothetical protein n=1 Tax=Streptomyces sp. NPDC052236 TaxID=3365686 RepID=UPI0037CE28BF